MKWQTKELSTYFKEKEYIDTAIIPLIPISWQTEVKSTVAMGEFISIIALEVERQFQGRVIHFPPFTYVASESMEENKSRMQAWIDDLKKGGIAHIFLLTSDSKWKAVEQQLDSMLIWLPTVPLEHLEEKYKKDVIDEQIKQLIPLMIAKWQET